MNYKKILYKSILLLLYTISAIAYQDTTISQESEGDLKQIDSIFTLHKKDLDIAKRDQDTAKMAQGFYYLSIITDSNISQKYSDSVIALTQNRSFQNYPMLAYQNKATIYYNEGNFKQAFDYYLKTNEEAQKYNNELYFHQSIRDMAILKAHVGEHETGLEPLKKCYEYFSKIKETNSLDYLITLFALSDSYNKHKMLDSATLINMLGIEESIRLDNKDFGDGFYFTFNEGINQYYKENYQAAKDSLDKSLDTLTAIGDLANEGMAYYYLGKTLSALNDQQGAINAHKKVDEIFQKTPRVIPESRQSYEILISHYKKIGDRDNQLKYIERLITIDSVINSNYKYLIKNVVQKYDTPRLLSEKQEIIDSLEDDKKSSTMMNIILVVVSILFLSFWIFNYFKRRNYKKKFHELYYSSAQTKVGRQGSLNQENQEPIGVSEEIIEDILHKLDEFEKNLNFLQPDITTSTLSKTFNTNSKYLSKVVNRYKKKNFSVYINDLRIDYSVAKLKEDQKFKHYTMKAIAQEIGFNTTQAFSKSFYKKNGIHPSYFIKQLQRQ